VRNGFGRATKRVTDGDTVGSTATTPSGGVVVKRITRPSASSPRGQQTRPAAVLPGGACAFTPKANICAIDGACYDLPSRMAGAGPKLKNLVTRAFGDEGPDWDAASPVRRVAPGAPPILITASSQRPAARDQAERLATALRDHAVPHRSLAFDKTHAEMNQHAGRSDDPLTEAILAFLAEHVAP